MRLFILVAVLLITAGVYLLVGATLRISGCLDAGILSLAFWTSDFWLLAPGRPGLGIGPNGHWFLRLTGGLALLAIGRVVLRISNR